MIKKNLLIILIFFLYPPNLEAGIIINEIMYNPIPSDNYNEWIELYNNGDHSINLKNWTLCNNAFKKGYINHSTNSTTKELTFNTSYMLKPLSYAVITDGKTGSLVLDNFNIPNETLLLHVDSSSICKGLSNSGKEIVLSNKTNNWTIIYTDNAEEGYSLEFINYTWINSLDFDGSPGMRNKGIINESIEQIYSNSEIDIEIVIDKDNYSLNDKINISGKIISDFLYPLNSSLTIKLGKKINGNWKYKWFILEDYHINLSGQINFTAFFNNTLSYTVPDNLIKGEYKILATLKYQENTTRHRYCAKEFYIDGLEDLGEHNMTIIKSPESIRFGDIGNMLIEFNSNNYNFENLTFIAYIYSPRWASIDLSDNTLRTKPYKADTAVNIINLSRGKKLFAALPLLTKRNCENDYDDGEYIVRIRGYNNDEIIIEDDISVELSEKNDGMCPERNIVYKNKKLSQSNSSKKDNNIFTYDDVNYEINIPKNITETFDIEIIAYNLGSTQKTAGIWSYAYHKNHALMDRKHNKLEFNISPRDDISIKLKNLITEDIDPYSKYRVMVKINSSNRKNPRTYSDDVNLIISDKPLPKITGFYAIVNNSKKTIKLFAESDCTKGEFILESFNTIQKKDCSKNAAFIVELNQIDNPFFLRIEENGSIFDIKKLSLKSNNSINSSLTDNYKTQQNLQNYNNLNKKSNNSDMITGNAIDEHVTLYESDNIKLKKLIKYLIPILIILLIMIWKRIK